MTHTLLLTEAQSELLLLREFLYTTSLQKESPMLFVFFPPQQDLKINVYISTALKKWALNFSPKKPDFPSDVSHLSWAHCWATYNWKHKSATSC